PAVAVMVADPAEFAVTVMLFPVVPLKLTTLVPSGFSTLQVTVLFVAFGGVTVAVSCNVVVVPSLKVIVADVVFSDESLIVTPVTGTVTVTSQVAFTSELAFDVAVIVAVPLPTAVTTPFSTVATESLLEVH